MYRCAKKTVSGKVNFTGKFYYNKVGREAYHYCIRCKILKLKCIVDRVDHCDSGSNSQWLYHYRQSRNSKIILLCKYARSGGGGGTASDPSSKSCIESITFEQRE